MNFKKISIVFASCALVGLIGCAKVPQTSIDDAKGAIEKAKSAGAEVYSVAQLQTAQESLDKGMAEIDMQAKKLPFLRDYAKATELFATAKSSAETAVTEVEKNKETLKGEVQGIVSLIQADIDSMTLTLTAASKNKKLKATIDSLTMSIDSLKAALAVTTESIAADPMMAKQSAAVNQATAATIKASVTALPVAPAKK